MSTSRTSDATIQNRMPRPLSALWSALLACRETAERTVSLVGVLECTLQITESLLVADYLAGTRTTKVDDLLRDYSRPTIGTRALLIQEVLRALRDRGHAFAPDSVSWWWDGRSRTEHADRVDRLVKARNRGAHDPVKGRPALADSSWAEDFERELRALLDSMVWLHDRPLGRVIRSEQTTRGRMRGTVELIIGQERPAPRLDVEWPATVPLLRDRVYWFSRDLRQALDVSSVFGIESGVAEPILLVAHAFDARGPALVDPLGLRPAPEIRGYAWGDQRLTLDALLARRDGAERRHEIASEGDPSVASSLAAGQTAAGRYQLIERLGAGGMAEVWRARDDQTGQEVALKVMLPHAAQDTTLRDRFSREAETMRRVHHPRVLACLHAETVHGRPALVLPLMRGGTLQAQIPCTRMDQVWGWTRDALEGLAALHAKGVVHRDIKPSNLFLDDEGRIKIGDLGVMFASGHSRLTMTQEVVGTLAYMAPEQLNGEDASPLSDVFALALVLHQLVTGSLPADRQPGRGIRGDLGELLRGMGEPDPTRRIVAMEALARVAPHLKKAYARPPGLIRRAARAVARAAFAATMLVVLGAVGTAAAAFLFVAWLASPDNSPAPMAATNVRPTRAPAEEPPAPARSADPEVSVRHLVIHREPAPKVDSPVGLSLMRVAAGRFEQGTSTTDANREDDETLRTVTIPHDIYVASTEVTQGQWKDVVGTEPWKRRGNLLNKVTGMDCATGGVGDALPAMCMTWKEAVEFCNALSEREGLKAAYVVSGDSVRRADDTDGYRLPTEAEWEWFGRSGSPDAASIPESQLCSGANVLGRQARKKHAYWTKDFADCKDRHEELAPVGSFPPDALGLYDVLGNVWEWSEDWYAPYTSAAVADPRGPAAGTKRVLRGGSWYNDETIVRVGNRFYAYPDDHSPWVGLRVVRELSID